MNSFFDVLPQEIIQKNIFTQVDLLDALSFTEISVLSHGYGLSNEFWADLIFKKYGISVHPNKAFQKFLLLYYFHKMLAHAIEDNLWGVEVWDEKPSLGARLCFDYFQKMEKIISELGETQATDVGWMSYVTGIMALLVRRERNTFLQLMTPLMVSSAANYSPATLLLTCMNLHSVFSGIDEFDFYLFPGGIKRLFANVRLGMQLCESLAPSVRAQFKPQIGRDLLQRAYSQQKNPAAAIILAVLLWLEAPADKQKVVELLSADFCVKDPACLLWLGKFRLSLLKERFIHLKPEEMIPEIEVVINTVKQAADQGSADAASVLSTFYSDGKWLPFALMDKYINLAESFRWRERAAELGDVYAARESGEHYAKLEKPNLVLAIKYFELGASCQKVDDWRLTIQGDCLYELAHLEPDLLRVLRLLARGEKIEHHRCMLLKGVLYATGHLKLGLKPNEQKAENYFNSLLFSPAFQSANYAAANIVGFMTQHPLPFADHEAALRFEIKWNLRLVKLSDALESRDILETLMANIQVRYQMDIKNQSAYASLNRMIADMSKRKSISSKDELFRVFVAPGVSALSLATNQNTDLTPLAELLHQAFDLPYTPDEFLRQDDPVEKLRASVQERHCEERFLRRGNPGFDFR